MPDKTAGQSLLENAYSLATPQDNLAYYRAFAETYDTDFAAGLGWSYPKALSDTYRRLAGPEDCPVADIGCGTGYVAAELGLPAHQIDGFDISPEMLAIARDKGLYRGLYEADLTQALDAVPQDYGAVVSAGTFTHGHLGPGPLAALVSIARPGALFVIGVNQVHFDRQGFAAVLAGLRDSAVITDFAFDEINMYSKPGHAHSNDRALILQYRKR